VYIIDKYKDYYDFHSYIFGVDKSVIFDRRGSKYPILSTISNPHSYRIISSDDKNFILLEIGYTQYLIMLYDFIMVEGLVKSISVRLVRTFKDNKNHFGSAISIRGASVNYTYRYGKGRTYKINESFNEVVEGTFNEFVLPILAQTKITSLIDSQEIWIELQTYISSLDNDKDIRLKMTDKEKVSIHGFDKNSFRNPIK